MENNRKKITQELQQLLEKGNAHVSFDEAVADLPRELRTVIPNGVPYHIWQLVEHIRIAQADIVDFCVSDHYQPLVWPDDYWISQEDKPNTQSWTTSLKKIAEDRKRFLRLLEDPDRDLFTPFAYGTGQNLFQEALVLADHNAYHTGEIVLIRRLLHCWK